MTTLEHIKPILGGGVFTLEDVSLILKIELKEVKKVLRQYWEKRYSSVSNLTYTWGEGKEKSINFLSLIEIKTFFELKDHGVKTQKINIAHDALSVYFNTPYPFAKSTLQTDGVRIMFEDRDALISADPKLQSKISEVIIPFCQKIDYGPDLLAKRYFPKGKDNSIVIDPKHKFGQPTILHSNILAEVIYGLYLANEQPEFIAKLYEVSVNEVNDAISFYKDVA